MKNSFFVCFCCRRQPGSCGDSLPKPRFAMVVAVLATSLLFAIAHHVGPYGEPFLWFTFLFRVLAGIFFAVLFLYRGFGIAAGAHAGYDILVGLTMR